MMTQPYEFIIWSDTPNSNPLEVEALTYDSENKAKAIAANSFVVINDAIQQRSWFGQVVSPQLNIARGLSKDNPNSISALERVLSGVAEDTVFLEQYHHYRIKLIGEITQGYLESVRVRPRYGAKGRRATSSEVTEFIRFPALINVDQLNNVLGIIKDSDIPICIDKKRIFYHVLLAGATGGGKSNTIGNIIKASQALGMASIIIDHKPDYQDMHRSNTEAHLFDSFDDSIFAPFGLGGIKYFRLHTNDDYQKQDRETAISICAGDASHDMLATALFYRSGEELQREAFFSMLGHFREHLKEKKKNPDFWTLKDFEQWVNSHRNYKETKSEGTKNDWSRLAEYFNGETPNEKVIGAMLHRIATRKPAWMDTTTSTKTSGSTLSGVFKNLVDTEPVTYFDPLAYLEPGAVLVIRRPQSSGAREYGLFLSYLLQRVYDLRRLNKIQFHVTTVIDEAQDIFSGDALLKSASERIINETLRKGRSKGMGFVIAVQSASQLPNTILTNLNTRIIHRQNSEDELKYAIPGVPKDMLSQVVNFASGEALVKMYGVSAPVHAQMSPSPFELTKDEFEQ